MTVICWEGKPRTGKTLGMVMHAYSNHLKGIETLTNFEIRWDSTRLDIYDILQIPFDDVDRHPKQVLIQEADKWFDSWLKNEETRLLSSFTGQSGKRNLDILYDTQFFSRIQKSLRRVTEYVITCSCYVLAGTKQPIAFEYQINELDDQENKIPLGKPFKLPITMSINGKKIYEYYDMYDSYETTKPFITEEREGN